VIYTSGSTGKPKGVVVPHRAVVNFLTSMRREPSLKAEDRFLAVTTLSFDIAVLELLLPLTVGAQVILASRDQAIDGVALRALLESSNATAMQATPATWRILLEAGWVGSPGFKALVGGEALPPDLAKQLLARSGELWNMYGPTETTVWSTCARVEQLDRGISIGRPIANTTVRVLDEHRKQCPIGVPGEICIGGDGVTLGYHKRPELTAERFIDDPFGTGGRLYRTGDRGRWRPDGQLEHLGRFDFQVKLRGFRIELGEIESNLATHPGIGRCLVTTREQQPGDVRLIAYVVPRGPMPGALSFRDHLRRTLPDHMLPQHYVKVEAIPLLPNGKVDRAALPAPEPGPEPVAAETPAAPQSDAERHLIEIWSELLGVDRIGVNDNFFDLGGHSLLALRAIAAAERRLGTRVNPRRYIFETLGQLARAQGEAVPRTPADSVKPRVWRRVLGALRGLGERDSV